MLVTGAVGGVGRAAVFTASHAGSGVGWRGGARRKRRRRSSGVDGVVALDDDAEMEQDPAARRHRGHCGGRDDPETLARVKPGGAIGSVLGRPRGPRSAGSWSMGCKLHPDPKRLAEIGRVVEAGKFVIPIAKRFPLAEVREAQKFAESGASGKVILIV